MKIVHVLAPADAGGLERVVHALAIGQHRLGHRVVAVPIVDEWTSDHPFAGPLARANVEVTPIVVPARAYRRERSELATQFRQVAPDIVHSHGYHSDVLAGGVARSLGVATVATAHGFTRGGWRNRGYELLDRLALRRFDAVVAVSRPLARQLIRSGVAADRVHVVPNAWSDIATPLDRASARRRLELDASEFVVGWVGRMSREKGLDVLVDALSALTDLPIRVCAIGDGPERGPQAIRAASAGVGQCIRWAGLVREAGRYFPAFDALVLSSRTEGVPMVVLEAMGARVPLVVTAVGGLPDVVSPREALLVPAERPLALAQAIRDVFTGRARAIERAEAAAERLAREFAERPWLESYDRVYHAALAASPRPRRT
jgi:glycosyltransferase involved in cell wall biosynthesis